MKKILLMVAVWLPVFTFSFIFQSKAQSLEDVKTQMIKDWERAKSYTLEYLNTMPASDYSFRAVDSIRSFAQQMLHLSQGCSFLMSNAVDQAPPSFVMSDMEHSPGAQSKDSVMYYVNASYDYCINAIKNLDISKWFEKKKLFSFEETRFAIINKSFEHQTHHRDQTTIYIRLKGIKPPQEKLF
jgi:DinB family